MKKEKANLIVQYINRLYNEVEECRNDFLSLKCPDDLYDLIREIVNLFDQEIPDLYEKLLWRNGCEYTDADLTIAILKKYLIDNNMIDGINSDIHCFWNRFKAWYNSEVYSYNFLKSEYLQEDINSVEPYPCIDYEHEYMINYGISYPLSLKYEIYDFQEIVSFIEIVYNQWINIRKRYEYTKYVNQLFSSCNLPYQLKTGNVIFKGYQSSDDTKIINQKMFEDKLNYSRKLILSNDKKEKSLALKLIIDCLEYLESIQANKSKQREELAKSVSSNPQSKLISVVRNDLNSIFAMTNEYFDIRHNKENTNQGEKREILENIADIEYIYNRIHATVQLLSVKVKEKNNGKDK